MNDVIRVRGVRVHNLKNISFDLPLNRLIVVTGVSGSGKSSLAFDTLYAEGQRRYVESFSAYARQFLERMDRPDADHIEGIPPAIAIEQKNPIRTSRSTVGTATEILDFLRLLFARVGRVFCEHCGHEMRAHSTSAAVDEILRLPAASRVLITFPHRPAGKASDRAAAAALVSDGFVRVVVDGRVVELGGGGAVKLKRGGEVLVVVDRLVVGSAPRERLADSIETAFRQGGGRAVAALVDGDGNVAERLKFANQPSCPDCGAVSPPLSPQLFSFNSPLGACPRCHGFGDTVEVDMDKVVPDKSKSIRDGAIVPWTSPVFQNITRRIIRTARKHGLPVDVPFRELEAEHLRVLEEGTDDFPGLRDFFEWLETKKYKMHMRVFLSRFRSYRRCPECNGTRLKPPALHVKVAGKNIAEICMMNVSRAREFFESLSLTGGQQEVAELLVREILKRLTYLDNVGAGYLTLDRPSRTLSGGEAQRVNLTTSLGSGLVNTLYVLDEPSIGLHPRDSFRLIRVLKDLRDIGNTVLVVEHDREMIEAADLVLDLGPGAGERGGEIVFFGPPNELARNPESLTGAYLAGRRSIEVPKQRRTLPSTDKWIRVLGCRQHNLKDIDAAIPLGVMTCISGVSGSGKSTLVVDTLYHGLKALRGQPEGPGGLHRRITGAEHIADVVLVDQSPIGRTPRSNPVTYVKAFDPIRKLFAQTREAKLRALTAGHFSFNSPLGQCPDCKGQGFVKVEMHFLADVFVLCDRCDGTRYRPAVLEVRYRSKTICDVLSMTVSEAMAFFGDRPKVVEALNVLHDVGLGYMQLGQPATTLSGGEAQRLKLAAHLALGGAPSAEDENESHAGKPPRRGRADDKGLLFIFDEPTTGLHFEDIRTLLACFDRLLERGHTVLVVEHNLDVLKCADWLIDLGPEGGDEGGNIVAAGTPEAVANVEASHTGQFLRRALRASEVLLTA